jgi:hypothetical protein
VKTGDDGKMFGTVTTGAITDELKRQFDVSLDKKKIHIEKPIRALGDFEVELHLHPEVRASLKIRVESTTPPPAVVEAPAAAKGDDKKGDKVGAAKGERAERKPRTARAA